MTAEENKTCYAGRIVRLDDNQWVPLITDWKKNSPEVIRSVREKRKGERWPRRKGLRIPVL